MEKIDAKLRRLMSERGMTRAELCRLTGIPKSAMSQYVNGRHKPDAERIEAIAKALGITAWQLIDDKANAPEDKPVELTGRNKITIREAARRLGKSEDFVRIGLQRKILPFGVAVPGTGGKYSYYISPAKFKAFVGD